MSSPARLQKEVEDKSIMAIIDRICMKYAWILLPIFIIVLLVLILVLIVVIVDISSAHIVMDSGNYYNHLKDVI